MTRTSSGRKTIFCDLALQQADTLAQEIGAENYHSQKWATMGGDMPSGFPKLNMERGFLTVIQGSGL